MIQVIPDEPSPIEPKKVRMYCPHCKTASKLLLVSAPKFEIVREFKLTKVVAGYACENCLSAMAIAWNAEANTSHGQVFAYGPELLLRSVEPFDFEHVPVAAKADIEEALNCLSVNAYNGFAAVCRRAVQAICTDLGADSSSRVEKQIDELAILLELDEETVSVLKQIMLAGHDGAHPQLPAVDVARASLILALLRDIVFQLYTRPGRLKTAAEKRKEAILQQKGS